MTETPATFDIIGAIEGRTYPEVDVPFILDEAAANAIAATDRELQKFLALGKADEYQELEEFYFKAMEDLKPVTSIVTVRSVPRKVKKAILQKVESKYPDKKNALGQYDDNFDGIEYHNILTWQSRIKRIVGPSGAVLEGPLTEGQIEQIMDEAPEASTGAVARAIEELDNGSQAGYEQAVRNIDFLSSASPEATADGTPQD